MTYGSMEAMLMPPAKENLSDGNKGSLVFSGRLGCMYQTRKEQGHQRPNFPCLEINMAGLAHWTERLGPRIIDRMEAIMTNLVVPVVI